MLMLRAAAVPPRPAARWISSWGDVKRGVVKPKGKGPSYRRDSPRRPPAPKQKPAPPAPPAADQPAGKASGYRVQRTESGQAVTAKEEGKLTGVQIATKSALSRALGVAQRKKKRVSAKKLQPYLAEAARQELTEEQQQAEAKKYAAGLLQNVPRKWLQESSVVREALGLPPTQYIEPGEDVNLLEAGEEATAALPPMQRGAASLFDDVMDDLNTRVAKLETLAMKVREKEGAVKPQLAGSQAYLDLIERAPTGVEAATWLDELEMLSPEWLTPDHYEAAFRLATEKGGALPERDVMVLWVKARNRGMATSNLYAHMFAGMGVSSLRSVAFPLVWEAAKRDFGVATLPVEISEAVFLNKRKEYDAKGAIDVYLELSKAGARLGLRSYFELVRTVHSGLAASGADQEVCDFLMEEMQAEAGRVLTEAPETLPSDFFAHCLAISSPENAIRLWHFMKGYGIRVTQQDYINLAWLMAKHLRCFEVEEIIKYLALHHPDYLWADGCRIPKLALRMYAKRAKVGKAHRSEQGTAMYYFSEYFGPESGTPPDVSAYMQLIQAVREPKFIFELWREMLARGMELESKHYDIMFSRMNGKKDALGALRKRIPYKLGANALDAEMPRELQERPEDTAVAQVASLMPPAVADVGTSWDIYNPTPDPRMQHGSEKSMAQQMVEESKLPAAYTSESGEVTPEVYLSMKRAKKSAAASRARKRRPRRAASAAPEETASAA